MKKNLLIFLAFILIINMKMFAQQEPQFTQNMFNQMAINPAYAGMKDLMCAKLFYRNQWVGFDGSPKELEFTADAPVPILHGGLGLTIYQDQIGFFKNVIAGLSYSYKYTFASGAKLGFGIRLGAYNTSVNGVWVAPDGTNGATDQAIPPSGSNTTVFISNLGVTYMTNDLHVGLATCNVNQPTTVLNKSKSSDLKRHYDLTAGYNYYINPNLILKPSVYFKTDVVVVQMDLNCLLETKIRDRAVWAGLTYRPGDALAPMFGLEILSAPSYVLNLGYSYDITLSQLGNYSTGSHEIFLGLCFKLERVVVPSKYRNPMFL